jgi:hypothetical protein
MQHVVTVSLVIVAVIHLLPLSGVVGVHKLELLYGTPIMDPNLEILMRHRAVLFGLLGMFFLFAAFRPQLQVAAFLLGFISVLSFLWLAWSVGGYNAHIGRVFAADIVALVALVIGAVACVVPRAA